jgi:4a-hydroxytetrahydrobiopterin dehydratase
MVSTNELSEKRCKPCEGGVSPLSPEQVRAMLSAVPNWQLSDDGKGIRRSWRAQDFMAALEFFAAVGKIAEAEDHHPDLHLTGYRNVLLELSTHAIGGLSENDFILAAKIDRLPIRLKKE